MRSAWLIVLVAACGGGQKSTTPATEPTSLPIAVNGPSPPPPPGVAPDPCEGGQVAPTSGGDGMGVGGVGGIGSVGTGSGHGRVPNRGHGPVMHLGQATGEGPLDKAIIRRYIKRNLQKIQSCYDKELLASPGLAGTVTVTFEIGVDGGVASSIGTGLANVDACVAGVIKGIEFPKPAAVTKVNYPFEFSPSGAEQP